MFSRSTLLAVTLAVVSGVNALSSTLQQITANIGSNPNNVGFYIYKPTKLASPTPLIVALHECSASAQVYFGQTNLPALADEHGFIIIYGNAPRSGGCWDVSSSATLTHNGGGDSLGVANVARYAISNLGVDASQVFVTGSSSGAMLTSVMLGAYPDIFAAGSAYSGVAFGCFAGSGTATWNSQCSEGEMTYTAQQWGQLVFNAYPGFTGTRPRVQFWHGTADTTLNPQNFYYQIEQWTDVFGVSQTPTSNITNDPQSGYSTASYGPNIQAILAQGVGHGVPEHENITVEWFGLQNLTPGSSTGTGSSTGAGSTSTSTPASTPSSTSQAEYGQCGGIGWTGPTTCVSPYTCKAINSYYSQCL